MRRMQRTTVGGLLLVLAVLLTAATSALAGPQAEVASTCMGKTVTISDHAGRIAGTLNDDVIIGDNEPSTPY